MLFRRCRRPTETAGCGGFIESDYRLPALVARGKFVASRRHCGFVASFGVNVEYIYPLCSEFIGYPGKTPAGEVSLFAKSVRVLAPCFERLPTTRDGLRDPVCTLQIPVGAFLAS